MTPTFPRNLARLSLILLLLLFCSSKQAFAEKNFTITSEPAGARVEINSEFAGTTPIERKMKDHWFNGPKYLWSDFLNVPLQLTVSKEGYVSQTILITKGPFKWVNMNNTAEKIYYVINSTSFHVRLKKIGEFLGNNPLATPAANLVTTGADKPGIVGAPLSVEQVVQFSLPSVVTVQAGSASGSGFIITESGIVVTNRHVISGMTQVSVTTSKGKTLRSDSLFVHPTKDLALIKLPTGTYPFLKLADPPNVNVGADVVAIGSPGLPGGSEVLVNTVTKGIVSAFRKSDDFGLLIQTDVNINHGNSGGPLLNLRGEVVGVNTLAFREGGATGLNFAIFDSEVLDMLKQHFSFVPDYLPTSSTQRSDIADSGTFRSSDEHTVEAGGNALISTSQGRDATPRQIAKMSVTIASEPSGAEIFVDGQFDSSTPSKLLLTPGEHVIKVVRPGFKSWERTIKVETGAEKTVNALLERQL